MSTVIRANNLSKHFGNTVALDNVNLSVDSGQILGVIGPNGAGKTTLLRSLMGLSECKGDLKVLGLSPMTQHKELMQSMSFIADVATLPRWMTVEQAVDFMQGVHPRFNRDKALGFLHQTKISLEQKVKTLSKGMVVQAHLALIMAVDAKVLILDEPTLGLDIIYRDRFYQSLLNDYYSEERTIIITTHQVEEVESILTDIMMIDNGQIVLESPMATFTDRFVKVVAQAEFVNELRKLGPISERSQFGEAHLIFQDKEKKVLEMYGKVMPASVAEVFIAKVGG